MQRFKNILCIMNPHENASSALQRATELASRQDARLTLVDVVRDMPPALVEAGLLSDDMRKDFIAERKTHMQSQLVKNAFAGETDIKVLVGIPFIEIIRQILLGKHDLLIKPTESSGLGPLTSIYCVSVHAQSGSSNRRDAKSTLTFLPLSIQTLVSRMQRLIH